MPGFDGTGPRGEGSLTGGGLGPCGRGMRRGFGRGFGPGFGRGFGRGLAWRGRYLAEYPLADYPTEPVVLTKDEQVKVLEAERKEIESELEALKKEIEKLKKPK